MGGTMGIHLFALARLPKSRDTQTTCISCMPREAGSLIGCLTSMTSNVR